LFGIGGSSSKTDRNNQLGSWGSLSSLTNQTQQIGGQNVAAGESNIGTGANFFQSLLSNKPGAVAQAVSPQVSAVTGQAQQQRQQAAEFGNRGGGTNATQQATTSTSSGEITNLINSLIPSAASNLETIGGQQESLGLTALGQAGTNAGTLGSLTGGARTTDLAQNNAQGAGIASLLASGAEGLQGGGGASDVLSSLIGGFA
ncbi:MAG TPA: hypothetical protein VJY15_06220, partial [Candidatus Acidoferrum sp.]|nr:hypothetical protein [Candidatus Acidoferrum sp.]